MESEVGLKDLLGLPESVWLGQVAIDFNQPPLGTGSDAIVYRCVYDDLVVAAKVLHGSLIAPGNVARREFIRKFGQECSRLRQLSNPCVVSFIGVGQAPNRSPCLLVELMEERLADRIAAAPADPFLQSLSYLLDVATGLRYLHWQRVIHRDLKPQNILIVAGKAKIADVGLARSLHGDSRMARQAMTRCPGTPDYMAPESLDEGRPYDEKLDMFALGAIVLGVFTHRTPTPTVRKIRVLANGREVATSELERRRNDLGHMDANHPTRPLVINCLQDDPALRPTAVQAHQQLMIIQQGFGGDDKPLLSSTLGQVVTRLDGLTTAVEQQESQQQLEVREPLRQLQNQVEDHEERHRQQVDEQEERHRQQMEEQRQQYREELTSLRQEICSQQANTGRLVDELVAGMAMLRDQVQEVQRPASTPLASPEAMEGSAKAAEETLGDLDKHLADSISEHRNKDEIHTDDEEDVILTRVNGALGFRIIGGNDRSSMPFAAAGSGNVFISKVSPNGAADICDKLRIGDCILTVDEQELTDRSRSFAVSALMWSGEVVKIRVRHDRQPSGLINVQINRIRKRLGINIKGGMDSPPGNPMDSADEGIFISKIRDRSAASKCPHLRVGQRLLEVNDRTLLGASVSEAVSLVKKAQTQVKLLLCDGYDVAAALSV